MAEIYATTNEATGNLYDKVIDKIKGTKPDNGAIYVNKKGEVALALKFNNKCYVKAYDSNKITQSKDENCIVPVDYLMVIEQTNGDDTKVFNSEIKRSAVERIITVSTNEVPSDIIGSFDVSEKQNGSIMAWYKDEDGNGLYELYIGQDGGVKANSNSKYLFALYTNATNIDLSNLDTSNVTDFSNLFVKCTSVNKLDLNNFNTSKAIDMSRMFQYCTNLQELNIKNFDTSNVINIQRMFLGCSSLQTLDLNNFNTNNVTNMQAMFQTCTNLKTINLNSFNTLKVTDMSAMFNQCQSLEQLNISNFDTSNVTNMKYMFQLCKNLENLNLSNFITSNVVNMDRMFNQCTNLKTINMNKADFTKVTEYPYMFGGNGVTSITVKDETAKTFIEARLTDASITGTTVTIG